MLVYLVAGPERASEEIDQLYGLTQGSGNPESDPQCQRALG
jgi:hypothetical protein